MCAAAILLGGVGGCGTDRIGGGETPGLPPSMSPMDHEAATPISTQSGLEVKVTEPQQAGIVPQVQIVQGVASGLPSGNELWAVVKPGFDHPLYHPQVAPIRVSADGHWSIACYLGQSQDGGKPFVLYLMNATRQAGDSFRGYLNEAKRNGRYDGMPDLPPGAEALVQVGVTRQ